MSPALGSFFPAVCRLRFLYEPDGIITVGLLRTDGPVGLMLSLPKPNLYLLLTWQEAKKIAGGQYSFRLTSGYYPLISFYSYGTSIVKSRPVKTKFGRLRPFMYLAAVCESAVTRMGSAMVVSQLT